MTPAAMTSAAKRSTETAPGARPASARAATLAPGHRRSVSPASPSPRPRRVSGPASGRVAAPERTAPPARRVTQPHRAPAPPRTRRAPAPGIPRRVTGPVQRPALGVRALAGLRALPDHSLLDRLIRGRTWIALLGVMLVGIVAMQVEVLKLGASMGRSIERANFLQGRNESLRESVASLADDQRIERLAARRGMAMPAPTGVSFLTVGGGAAVHKALGAMQAPAPASFLARLTASGAAAGQTTASSSSSSTSTSSTSSTSATGAAPLGTGTSSR